MIETPAQTLARLNEIRDAAEYRRINLSLVQGSNSRARHALIAFMNSSWENRCRKRKKKPEPHPDVDVLLSAARMRAVVGKEELEGKG